MLARPVVDILAHPKLTGGSSSLSTALRLFFKEKQQILSKSKLPGPYPMQLHHDEPLRSEKIYPASAGEAASQCLMSNTGLHHDFHRKTAQSPCVLRRDGYSIQLADSPWLRSGARDLVQRMYSWRGYQLESSRATSHNSNRLTLVASRGDTLIGTVTLGLDSEEGLLADQLYGDEINSFRRRGAKVCELSKFALDPQHSSKEILAALFHLAYIYAHNVYAATDLFGEVHPRHAASHKRMFGFRQSSEMRTCARVDAPAVLLHLKLDYVGEKISFLAGSHDSQDRSLYRYCFSQQERLPENSTPH